MANIDTCLVVAFYHTGRTLTHDPKIKGWKSHHWYQKRENGKNITQQCPGITLVEHLNHYPKMGLRSHP